MQSISARTIVIISYFERETETRITSILRVNSLTLWVHPPHGLEIGSPMSPLLAELLMANFEKTLLFCVRESDKWLLYRRYVDDTLGLWSGSAGQFDVFLKKVNSLHPAIRSHGWNHEMESGGRINFLDLTLRRVENRIDFSIYKKPTHADINIHRESNHVHPWSHKQ